MKNLYIFCFCLLGLNVVAQTNKTKVDTSTIKQEPIFVIADIMPEFVGGEDAFYSWIKDKFKYPQAAKDNKVSGLVIVTFVVEKDGSLSNAKVLRSLGSGCDEEALRLISIMPKWIPGKSKGQTVCIQYNLPVRFSLE